MHVEEYSALIVYNILKNKSLQQAHLSKEHQNLESFMLQRSYWNKPTTRLLTKTIFQENW